MLANNIVERSYRELLLPLDRLQSAPIGFLYLEKLALNCFGKGAFSLRILPYLCYLISIPAFYKLALLVSKNKSIAIFSCALLCLNLTVLHYSNDVKQYSFDLLFGIVIFLSGIKHLQELRKQTAYSFAFVSTVGVFFSNVAVVSILIINLLLFLKLIKKDKKLVLNAGWPLVCNTTFFLIYYFLFIYGHPHEDRMMRYWLRVNAFLPHDLSSTAFYIALGDKLSTNLDWVITIFKSHVFKVGVIVVGLTIGALKNLKVLLFVLPLIVHLTLTYLGMYPFDKRLVLYLAPFTIFLFSYGLVNIIQLFEQKIGLSFIIVLVIPLVFLCAALYDKIPMRKLEDIKQSMRFIDKKSKDTIQIYVYPGAISAFKFHEGEFPNLGDSTNIIYGRREWGKRELYRKDLEQLDKNVWLVFSHVHTDKSFDIANDKEFLLDIMDELGYRCIDQYFGLNNSTFMYSRDK